MNLKVNNLSFARKLRIKNPFPKIRIVIKKTPKNNLQQPQYDEFLPRRSPLEYARFVLDTETNLGCEEADIYSRTLEVQKNPLRFVSLMAQKEDGTSAIGLTRPLTALESWQAMRKNLENNNQLNKYIEYMDIRNIDAEEAAFEATFTK